MNHYTGCQPDASESPLNIALKKQKKLAKDDGRHSARLISPTIAKNLRSTFNQMVSRSAISQTTLLTGAMGEIGTAIAKRLHTEGRKIHGIDKRVNGANRTLYESLHQIDLSLDDSVIKCIDGITRENLPGSIVLAAGAYLRAGLADYTIEKARDVFGANFFGHFQILCKVIPMWLDSSFRGQVIFITSQAGVTGGRDPVYAATKGALTSLMKSIAREYGEFGVRANAVSPGPLRTHMAGVADKSRKEYYRSITPTRELAGPESIADAVAWLLSPSTSSINGITIDIDGGLIRR